MFCLLLSRYLYRFIPFFSIFIFLISSPIWADDGNITNTDYTIHLSNMNPVNQSGNNASGVSWKWALLELLQGVSDFLLIMVPILAAISGLIAGYYYIFSSGDSEKSGLAKRIIQYNIMAIFIAFFSYGIIQFIALILK
jgi:hypothetical protein